jgi:hypothetical protein
MLSRSRHVSLRVVSHARLVIKQAPAPATPSQAPLLSGSFTEEIARLRTALAQAEADRDSRVESEKELQKSITTLQHR